MKRSARSVLIVSASVFVVTGIFRLASAGSLFPPSAPAATMHTLQEAYDTLVGTFNSTAVVASKQGDALQVSRCIIKKITGNTPCP